MASIAAGMDVSGDQKSGNHKFMSFVFGTEESLDAMIRRIGSDQIHMNMIKNKKARDDVIGQVRFDGRECIGFCVRLEKGRAIAKVMQSARQKHRRGAAKIHGTYHALVWSRMRDRTEAFLRRHGCEVGTIRFQCDADCRNFAKDVGWRYVDRGPAHTLADIVAWANSHGREPKGTVCMDMVDLLDTDLARRFK